MSKENRQRIFDYLMKEAREGGISDVRSAADLFLKTGMKAGAEPTKREKAPRDWIVKLWHRQKGICARCKDPQPMRMEDSTFDHINPLALSGEHSLKNGRLVHPSCNSSKGANDLITESKKTGELMTDMFPGE